MAAAVVAATMSCGPFCGGPVAEVRRVDFVQVLFWGSATVHTNPPGTQIVGDTTYRFEELALYEINSDNLVMETTAVDHLRGSGTVYHLSPLFGDCTATVRAPARSSGTEGVRVLNQGQEVAVQAIAPWTLHTTTSASGKLCGQSADPGAGNLGGDGGTDTLDCPLKPDGSCKKGAVLPAQPEPGTTQSGRVDLEAYRTTRYEDRELSDSFEDLLDYDADLVDAGLGALEEAIQAVEQGQSPATNVSTDALPVAPASGPLSTTFSQGGTELGRLTGSAQQGSVPPLAATWNEPALAALAGHGNVPVQVTASYGAPGGPPLTLTELVYLSPPPAAGGPSPTASPSPGVTGAVITGVAFHGNAAQPAVVVTGQNLGAQPPAAPAGHPSGQNGCPTVAGDQGYDYGSSLYIAFPAANWSAGRYVPGSETDCFDLVVTKFTSSEVDFTLGGLYAGQSQDRLSAGTAYQLVINSATYSGTVGYS